MSKVEKVKIVDSEGNNTEEVIATDHGNKVALVRGSAYLAQRKSKSTRSLHDQVEVYHVKLMMADTKEGVAYCDYLEPLYLEQSIEGNLILDDGEAARILRNLAKASGNEYIAQQKLGTLVKSINVVQRRFASSRRERRVG